MRQWEFLKPHFRLVDPLSYMYVTQGFGQDALALYIELGLKGHNGLDLRANYVPTFAVCDATVISSGEDVTGGRFVKYRSNEADVNAGKYRLEILHYHLESWSVKAGEKLKQGQQIGITGNTGQSTGPHLHFGITVYWKNGTAWTREYDNGFKGAVDPAMFLISMGNKSEPIIDKKKAMVFLKKEGDAKIFVQVGGQYAWVDMSFDKFKENFPSFQLVELSKDEFIKLPVSSLRLVV